MKKRSTHTSISPLFPVWAVVILIVSCIAFMDASGIFWGVHFGAFYSAPAAIMALVFAALCCIPRVQELVIQQLSLIISWNARLSPFSRRAALAVLSIVVMAAFWLARERTHLLGDGILLLHDIPLRKTVAEALTSKVEPFATFLQLKTWQALHAMVPTAEPAMSFGIISILCGMGTLIAWWSLIRILTVEPIDRLLMYGVLISSGAMALFFGYVENYPPVVLATSLWFLLSVNVARGKISLPFPAFMYGILCTLQFGAVCYLPAMIHLSGIEWRRGRRWSVGAAVLTCIVIVKGILVLCGYTTIQVRELFSTGGNRLLPFGSGTGGTYGALSWNHVLDLANLMSLVQPFLIPLILVGVAGVIRFRRNAQNHFHPLHAFLFIAGAGAAVLVFFMHFELGLSRDWDLGATFTWAMFPAAAAGYLSVTADRVDIRRRFAVMIAGIGMIGAALFIGINASETRGMIRSAILPEHTYWDRNAFLFYYDALTIYHNDRGDAESAISAFRAYLDIDSTNPRIWAGYSCALRKIHNTGEEIYAYERSISLGGKYRDVYENLSAYYLTDNRVDDASVILIPGLVLFPDSPVLNNNYGFVLMNRENGWPRAIPYFQRAIQADGEYVEAYYNAGLCYYHIGDTASAREYFNGFTARKPDSPANGEIQRMLGGN